MIEHRTRAVSLLGVAALLLALPSGCKKAEGPATYESRLELHGRSVVLRLAGTDEQFSETLNQAVVQTVSHAVEVLDATVHESDIARLNRIGSDARIQVSRDTYRLLDLARHYSVLTDGNYDPTVAPVAYLWGFEGAPVPTNVPPDDLRQSAMLGIGAHNVALFDNGTASLTHEQTRVSLESLIDAYCADIAIVEVRKKSIANGYIRVGQSARALGSNDGQPWVMRLPDPFGGEGSLGSSRIEPGRALSVVVANEKTTTIGVKNFSYIINPRTGLPSEGIAMAVVSGNIATKCCVIANALVVAGLKGAGDILKNFPGCEALIVPDRKPLEVWMTPGLASRVNLTAVPGESIHTIEVPATDAGVAVAPDAAPVAVPTAAK